MCNDKERKGNNTFIIPFLFIVISTWSAFSHYGHLSFQLRYSKPTATFALTCSHLCITGPYAEGGGRACKLFQSIQFFTRNWLYTSNFGPKIRIFLRFAPHFVKTFNSHPPFQKLAYGPVLHIMTLERARFVNLPNLPCKSAKNQSC